MALVAAGFIAGRGGVALGPPPREAAPSGWRSRLPRPDAARAVAATAVVAASALVAWAIWQPEASDRASAAR